MADLHIIDTHTGGEPTRVLVDGVPDLGDCDMASRRRVFRDRHDKLRSAIVNEPRGSDVMVGAVLCPPSDASCVAGVIFFNNVGVLQMCGHGTMGVAAALAHLRRISTGSHQLETPVGKVGFEYHGGGRVTLENVPSWRYRNNVTAPVKGYGHIRGDIAWGGNWFFLVSEHDQELHRSRVHELTKFTTAIRHALFHEGITGEDEEEIDHIEIFGPPQDAKNDSRNFVLCPGLEYDRSPCGTGTSAKLACLHADEVLQPGEIWRQESIIGSVFEGSYELRDGHCIPHVTGTAYVNAESTLVFDENDPYRFGIRDD